MYDRHFKKIGHTQITFIFHFLFHNSMTHQKEKNCSIEQTNIILVTKARTLRPGHSIPMFKIKCEDHLAIQLQGTLRKVSHLRIRLGCSNYTGFADQL